MTEDTGFQVTEEIEVGDLNAVQDDVPPQAQNVLVCIDKASVKDNKTKDLKSLNAQFRIVEGIVKIDEVSGEERVVYQNKVVFPGFMDLCVWASPERPDLKGWFKEGNHLRGFKGFCKALGFEMTGIKINDEWLANLAGQQLRLNIGHEIEADGKVNVRLSGFKAAE